MSVIRVGSTGKYAEGWDQIFGGAGGRGGKPGARKVTRKGRAAKASAKKAAGPKAAKKAATKKAKARRR